MFVYTVCMKRSLIVAIVTCVIVSAMMFVVIYVKVKKINAREVKNSPHALSYTELKNQQQQDEQKLSIKSSVIDEKEIIRDQLSVTTGIRSTVQKNLPDAFNLMVPFMVQAPHANWDMPYQEACEEASVLMAVGFLNGETSKGADAADTALRELIEWETTYLGHYEDTTVSEIISVLHERFGLQQSYIIQNPSVDDIKQAIYKGYPVIVPASGRDLHNPYFSGAGPLYHMLVIRGYEGDEFITNDPGTRRGEEYRYRIGHLMSVIHDWNDGDVVKGKRVAIVVR